jgi:serine protease AprX
MVNKSNETGSEEDPYNIINRASFKRTRITDLSFQKIPWHAVSNEPFSKKQVKEKSVKKRREKIHPLLKKWIKDRRGHKQELIINFVDYVKLPRFPDLVLDESRSSARNKKSLKQSDALVKEIAKIRDTYFRRITKELEANYGCKVLEKFWIINAVLVEMPLKNVSKLAKREDVMYIEPRDSGEKPPSDSNPNNDVDDGRRRIMSDPYFNIGLRRGWIGLLDTGVRFSHTQFNSPSHIDFRRDCVNGGADCNTGTGLNPNDDCWNHGTSSAAIITANTNQGVAFRGVTEITLDSFKVYPNSCGGLNQAAVLRGFQAAVAALDRVIVAEMQGSGDDLSAISTAGDNAFDAGAVIIAANGNNGVRADDGTVNTPANAHRVIGVGNFDVQTLAQIPSQSRGPAPDGRIKPDIQAPTNTETASSASDTAFKSSFGGTSGATPYAAGAAALLRNWLRGSNFSIDPGQVYAQLILSGQQSYPFNNTSGAGPIRLPTDGVAWWGKVSISNGQTIDIPLNIGANNANTFDGALWWPEWAFRILGIRIEFHNDIDLYLVDPTGSVRNSSISVNSVFERARVSGRIRSGTWKIRIRGYDVRLGPQVVYWAAAAHVRPT